MVLGRESFPQSQSSLGREEDGTGTWLVDGPAALERTHGVLSPRGP